MSRQTSRPASGRPPRQWLSSDAVTHLAEGVTVAIELLGRHQPRTVGRVLDATATSVHLRTATGEVAIDTVRIKRACVVPGLYEPGDPVLRRGVPASEWRGGVVRLDATAVLVEQISGEFAWFDETALEPASARDQGPPAERRGPVPARAG